MAADALAPCMDRSSATMVSIMMKRVKMLPVSPAHGSVVRSPPWPPSTDSLPPLLALTETHNT